MIVEHAYLQLKWIERQEKTQTSKATIVAAMLQLAAAIVAAMSSLSKLLPFIYQKQRLQCKTIQGILSSHPTNARLWGGMKDELP